MPSSRVRATAERVAHAATRVTVAGDLALDIWTHGRASRIAREAPVPVFDEGRTVRALGAAANTAANAAALGASVRVVGLVGADAAGGELLDLLAGRGVDVSDVVVDPTVRTTVKQRVVSDGQVMLRIDRGGEKASPAAQRELVKRVARATVNADGVALCDYGGPIREAAPSLVLGTGPADATIAVDAHDVSRWRDVGATVATPNRAEMEALLGERLPRGDAAVHAVTERGEALRKATGASYVAATLDVDGVVLVGPDGAVARSQTDAQPEDHASGAGDTFLAALLAARASGEPWEAALEFAQAAANVVTADPGTSVCDVEALIGSADAAARIVEATEAIQIANRERERGRTVVVANGCFDVLHPGHMALLERASGEGDLLVVALNDDHGVRRLKGPGRPINSLEDRARVVASLSGVDVVTSFSEDSSRHLLERLAPDVFVRGGTLDGASIAEAQTVQDHGGRVVCIDLIEDHSTHGLVERIRDRQGRAS